MPVYISREDALNELNRNSITKKLTLANGASIFDTIKNIPAADVVEVVRCGKCKCYEKMKSENACFCNRFGGYVTEHDYCSRAEKKEGAEE